MAYFLALATDYDGTIAHDGVVDKPTLAALRKLKEAGRKLILVTGRELRDLQNSFCATDLFDRIVAENGALLYAPASKEERPLGPPPSEAFVARLKSEGMTPLSIGRVIVATWEPNETATLEAIRDLGLDLQIIFNKGAVMVLPAGITKASGLAAALEDLGLSAHNVVGVGDAENDLTFMRTCGCAVAVGNALAVVKEAADFTTEKSRGAGVVEAIDLWLNDEETLLEAAIARHVVPLASKEGDGAVLRPDRGSVLISGASASGKSTLATALLEKLIGAEFQICLFDPEGDYSDFVDVMTFGDAHTVVSPDPVLAAVRKLGTNVAVNMLGLAVEERPDLFATLFPAIVDIHAKYGRPHWILIDEAHHMLPEGRDAGAGINILDQPPTIFVTVHPDTLATSVVRGIGIVLLIGKESARLIEALSKRLGRPYPPLPERDPGIGEVIYWECRTSHPPQIIPVTKPKRALKRHTRKYAEGTLGEDRSFYFTGSENALHIRAQNLLMFLQIGEGVDLDTYRYHLQRGDFSNWVRTAIKDSVLADEIAQVEAKRSLPADQARQAIRAAVERHYTASSFPQ
jgi:HAD superfamily hydrolase (TIGR01484 family)